MDSIGITLTPKNSERACCLQFKKTTLIEQRCSAEQNHRFGSADEWLNLSQVQPYSLKVVLKTACKISKWIVTRLLNDSNFWNYLGVQIYAFLIRVLSTGNNLETLIGIATYVYIAKNDIGKCGSIRCPREKWFWDKKSILDYSNTNPWYIITPLNYVILYYRILSTHLLVMIKKYI